MTQSPLPAVIAAQRAWAAQQGYAVDERGYLPEVAQNLFGGLPLVVRSAFLAADGGELTDKEDDPAKMRSLISSSALGLNVFQYWALRPTAPLDAALGLSSPIEGIEFERRLPTGTGRKPANLDVVLTLANGTMVGVESKFTEWMRPSKKQPARIEPYLRNKKTLWDKAGLKNAANLARAIGKGAESFAHLDAAQLLKHALGVNGAASKGSVLRYVWFDVEGEAGDTHREELARFTAIVGDELNFRSFSYQDLAAKFAPLPDVNPAYLAYLRERYSLGVE